jgi:hypothetical protein
MTVHTAQDRIVAALCRLAADQWKITAVPGMLTAVRLWPDGSVDTVLVLSPEHTFGRRDDGANRLMWQTMGSVDAVVRATQDLAPPGNGSV